MSITESKFNLIKSESQLAGTSGEFGDRKILSVGPNRDISNFSAGQISYKFACDAAQYVDLNKLALSANISLLNADGTTQLTTNEGIALAPDGNCLFDRLELLLNGTPLDSVSYPAQCAGYLQRTMKHGDYLNGFAQSTNNWDANVNNRVAEFASDGLTDSIIIDDIPLAPEYMRLTAEDQQINSAGTYRNITEQEHGGGTNLTWDTNTLTVAEAGVYRIKYSMRDIGITGTRTLSASIVVDAVGVSVLSDSVTASDAHSYFEINYIASLTAGQEVQFFARLQSETAIIEFEEVVIVQLPSTTTSASGGNVSERIKSKQILFQPALPIVQKKQKTYLPAGQYELRCTPNANWRTSMVQSTSAVGARVVDTNYSIAISNMRLHVPVITGPRLNDTVYLIDYCGLNCQPQNLSASTSTQEKQFSVTTSTKTLGVAWQSQSAGTNTLYPPSLFTMANDAQNSVNNLLITYAGQSYPSSGLLETGKDSTALSDYRNVMYAQAYDCSGNDNPESKADWSTRGNFGVASFLKDASSEATDVIVRQSFSTAPTSGRVLLFSEYRRVAQVTINSGRVTSVQVENA